MERNILELSKGKLCLFNYFKTHAIDSLTGAMTPVVTLPETSDSSAKLRTEESDVLKPIKYTPQRWLPNMIRHFQNLTGGHEHRGLTGRFRGSFYMNGHKR